MTNQIESIVTSTGLQNYLDHYPEKCLCMPERLQSIDKNLRALCLILW